MLYLDNVYYINKDQIKFRKEYFGALIFDSKDYCYLYLDKISSYILSCFEGGNKPSNVIDLLSDKYEITSEQVETDIIPLIENVLDCGYIIDKYSDSYTTNVVENNENYLCAPIEVVLNPNNKCNQKCIFCYHDWSVDNNIKRLTINEYEKIVSQEGWKDVFTYNILGGEPFIDRNFTLQLFEMLDSKKFNISTTTNGTVFTGIEKEISQELSKLKNFEIAVSLESSIEKTHDKITMNPGGYKKILEFLKELVKHVPNVAINTVISDYNYRDLYELGMLAKEIGVKVFRCTYPMPQICKKESMCFTPCKKEMDRIIERVIELEDQNFHVTIRKEHVGDYMKKNIKKEINSPLNHILNSCSAGNKSIEIDLQGDVYPCCCLLGRTEYSLGNVLNNTFYEIWQNKKLNEFRKADFCIAKRIYEKQHH